MRYSYKYFKNDFPEWKRKKDSLLVKFMFRPLSFIVASFFAIFHLSANTVSYLSLLVSILASSLFLFGYHYLNIFGAILVAIWMILDCTDGNLARSIKKQYYGDFADSSSSYILIGLLFICVGSAAYRVNGMFIQENTWWIILLGALASNSDSMARLVYHKFELNTLEYDVNHISNCKKGSENFLMKFQNRIDKEIGLNGLFIPFIIISSIFNWLDLFVIFYFIYYFLTFIGTISYLILKTYKFNRTNLNEKR